MKRSISFHQKARHRLRVAMKDRGFTAGSLAAGSGLSRSLIEKLMSRASKIPSAEVVVKIEDGLGIRLWSSPSEFKRRKASTLFQKRVAAVAAQESVSELVAIEIALSRFPSLATEAAL